MLYVEELIGPDTVNTMPPATMDAFRDHGAVARRHRGGRRRRRGRDGGARRGRDRHRCGDQAAGRRGRAALHRRRRQAARRGRAASARRSSAIGSTARASQLGEALATETAQGGSSPGARAVRSAGSGRTTRPSGRAPTRTSGSAGSASSRTSWSGPATTRPCRPEVKAQAFSDVVLLGMGGSSLGPEVLAETFGNRDGFPKLSILDSHRSRRGPRAGGHPRPAAHAVHRRLEIRLDAGAERVPRLLPGAHEGGRRRSGGRAFPRGHRSRLGHGEGGEGRRFPADLPRGAADRRALFGALGLRAGAGGLRSASMSPTSSDGARIMVRSCGPAVPPTENPGVLLGAAMGTAGLAGRDKVTIVASPGDRELRRLGRAAHRGIDGQAGQGPDPDRRRAASTCRPPTATTASSSYLRLDGHADARQDETLRSLEREGHPVVRITLDTVEQLPQEFFRFEMATAVAGAVLGINPFDQPDVEASKIETREAVRGRRGERRAAARDAGLRGRDHRPLRRSGQCRGAAGRGRGPRGRAEGAARPSRKPATTWRSSPMCRATRENHAALQTGAPGDPRRTARGDLPRIRAALPPLDRAGLQGRPRHRRVPADHAPIPRRSRDPGAQARRSARWSPRRRGATCRCSPSAGAGRSGSTSRAATWPPGFERIAAALTAAAG